MGWSVASQGGIFAWSSFITFWLSKIFAPLRSMDLVCQPANLNLNKMWLLPFSYSQRLQMVSVLKDVMWVRNRTEKGLTGLFLCGIVKSMHIIRHGSFWKKNVLSTQVVGLITILVIFVTLVAGYHFDIWLCLYSQLCLSRSCWDWRNSLDLEKIRLMRV